MGRDDPGSRSAIRKGCTCPTSDNLHGKGITTLDGDVYFWMDDDCPLHGKTKDQDDEEEEALDRYLLPRT